MKDSLQNVLTFELGKPKEIVSSGLTGQKTSGDLNFHLSSNYIQTTMLKTMKVAKSTT